VRCPDVVESPPDLLVQDVLADLSETFDVDFQLVSDTSVGQLPSNDFRTDASDLEPI
jgi:hypothetical protein